jgi:hypothetical protein
LNRIPGSADIVIPYLEVQSVKTWSCMYNLMEYSADLTEEIRYELLCAWASWTGFAHEPP